MDNTNEDVKAFLALHDGDSSRLEDMQGVQVT